MPQASSFTQTTRHITSSAPARSIATVPLGGNGEPTSLAPLCEMSTTSGNWYALMVTTDAGIDTGVRGARSCDRFQLGGIALGTIVIIAGYHLAKAIAPPEVEGTMMAVGSTGAHEADHAAPHLHKPEE